MRCQPFANDPVYIWTKNKQTCLLCNDPADTAQPLCSACEAELPWLGGHCAICALPLPGTGLTCGACLKRPPAFARVEVPWRYDFPVDSLITRFKHQAQWPLGRLLGGLLSHHLQHAFAEGLPRPDCLLPVPLGRCATAPRLPQGSGTPQSGNPPAPAGLARQRHALTSGPAATVPGLCKRPLGFSPRRAASRPLVARRAAVPAPARSLRAGGGAPAGGAGHVRHRAA